MLSRLLLAVLLALLATGCAGDDGEAPADEPAAPALAEEDEVEIDVVMGDILYQPTSVVIPAGTALVVHARNEGHLEHDFHVDDGETTGILQAGEMATQRFGPFEESTVAYCTVPGHREARMEFDITVEG